MTTTLNTFLSRDRIREVFDAKTEDVNVPEWGGMVRVKNMTGEERDDFEQEAITGKGGNREVNMKNFRARLIIRTCIDPEGNLLFDKRDEGWLGRKNAAAVERVSSVAMRLSGLSRQDAEELVGNSPDDASDDSTTS